VRVSAIRTALNARRSAERDRPRPELEIEVEIGTALPTDPELALLKAKYAGVVQGALEETLKSLDTDRRNVLRMHYFDDLSIDEIGLAYGVHRSTAARWIAQAREGIVDETKRRLRERIATSPSEISAILELVQSRLDVSLRTLL
jgi:RNA polymerase sigma-70 factor (ECF subfamily)